MTCIVRAPAITMVAGSDRTLALVLKDAAGATLDPATFQAAEFRLAPLYGGAAVAAKTLAAGGIVVDGANDRLLVMLNPVDTAGLVGEYRFQVRITDAAGEVHIPDWHMSDAAGGELAAETDRIVIEPSLF